MLEIIGWDGYGFYKSHGAQLIGREWILPNKFKWDNLQPLINAIHETSIDNVFVCGEGSGIEEASSAIVEGYYTGLIVAERLGFKHDNFDELKTDYHNQLVNLRSGPFGEKTRIGLQKITR